MNNQLVKRRTSHRRICWSALGVVPFLAVSARADVKLPALFSDNMVLQRGMSIPVWGTADPSEAITVTLDGTSTKTYADSSGKWKVSLAPHDAAQSLKLTVTGKNALAFQNVAVGEVWICSGQSNMEFPLSTWSGSDSEPGKKAAVEIAAANYPQLRLFTVAKNAIDTPQTDVKGKWAPCTPDVARSFSAVGYYFGRELQQKLGVPVGLIHTSWGGTPAQAWTSRSELEASPVLKGIVDNWDKKVADFPATLDKYQKETLPQWQVDADKAKAEGKPEPKKPAVPNDPTSPNRAANLYNGMVAPLIPYGIKGAIWYQGESNAGDGVYQTLFPTMIRDWRNRWGQGDFPFFWVQLANYQGVQTKPVEEGGWTQLREAQTTTLTLPNTGMATAIDLADADKPGDIHPKNKLDVGKRLALIALAKEYGQAVPYAGPTYDGMSTQGGKVRLSFSHTDGGLQTHGDSLKGFAISGADGVWKWADATVEGNTVVLSSSEVPAPKAVRYDWAINPIGNLYNGAGLPAFPFRSDTASPK